MQPDNLWVWSPPRMGSTSVAAALEILGYEVIHFCPLTHTETYVDSLDLNQPKTIVSTGLWMGESIRREIQETGRLRRKTILLTRDLGSWRASLDNFLLSERASQEYSQVWANILHSKCPDVFLFKVLDGWEKLCTIVGKPVPEVEFPRLNKAPQNWSI